MSGLNGVRLVVYPARDLAAGIAAWTAVLGREPVYQNADYAAFAAGGGSGDSADSGVEIGLSRLPWADHPLVFFKVEDVEKAHAALVASGAKALAQDSAGVLHPAGESASSGIVDVPGRRLAVLEAADGNLVGIAQDVPVAW